MMIEGLKCVRVCVEGGGGAGEIERERGVGEGRVELNDFLLK